jgi:hypothetical protein
MDWMADREFLVKLTRSLMDEGKLIEAGWVTMRLACIPLDAPAVQLENMKLAFMAGAQHLFSSMMSGLEDGDDATFADMRRMTLIEAELTAFTLELKKWVATGVPPRG